MHVSHRISLMIVVLFACAGVLPAGAQPGVCVPSSTMPCPLEFGLPTRAAILDAAPPGHLWRLSVPTSGAFAAVLSNLPARYRLSIYAPGASLTDPPLKSTLEDGSYLVVEDAGPGDYTIAVDSPGGETSTIPYTLQALRVLELGDNVTGILTDPNGVQTWMVNVRSGAPFSVSLTGLPADYNLTLVDLGGRLVGSSARPGTEDDVVSVGDLTPGRYLLAVRAQGAASETPYRLTVIGGAPVAAPPAPSPPTADTGAAPPPPTAPAPTPTPVGAPSETEIANRISPAVVQVITPYSQGSGVRIAQGILTNEHVVGGADRVEVMRTDGQKVSATALRCDPVLDLALLAADLDVPVVDLAPARGHRQGDPVLVLGFPLSDVLSGQSSLTRGLLSAIRQDERGLVVVQTDAAVNPGNSGGAMVNNQGLLIAVPAYTIRGTSGLNFGIATESVQAFLSGAPRPCSNGAAPDTVLLTDTFDDPVAGVLPLSSISPTRFASRYVENEYEIRLVDQSWGGLPFALVPGSYTDVGVAVEARVAGTIPGRVVAIGCRDPDGTGGYSLLVEPGNTRAILVRYDSGVPQSLTAWRSSPSIRGGNQSNQLELRCVGNVITGAVNGTQVGSVRDTTYTAGQSWLATSTSSGAVEGRFNNLVVTRR